MRGLAEFVVAPRTPKAVNWLCVGGVKTVPSFRRNLSSDAQSADAPPSRGEEGSDDRCLQDIVRLIRILLSHDLTTAQR